MYMQRDDFICFCFVPFCDLPGEEVNEVEAIYVESRVTKTWFEVSGRMISTCNEHAKNTHTVPPIYAHTNISALK